VKVIIIGTGRSVGKNFYLTLFLNIVQILIKTKSHIKSENYFQSP